MKSARVFVEALRLDRSSADQIRRRARSAVDLRVGGFVLFGGEATEVAALTADLRERSGSPLWIAADLERGAGQQFRGLSDLPPPAALAHHPEPEAAVRLAARVTAREALSVGVNWVLAPVLDLDVEPSNPIVGTRSFGADPARVAELGRAWIEACQAEGAAACMKHVPGHGRTVSDSHAELPVVDADRESMAADLAPFRAAAPVAATAMLAHVAYPALAGGSRRPATLEPALARDLLREELGFRGLAATDAMNMAGFAPEDGSRGDQRDASARAVAALRAGCDLLLYPEDLRSAASALAGAAGRSEEVRSRLDEAIHRGDRTRAALAPGGERPADPVGPRPSGLDADVADPDDLDRLAEACVVAVGDPPCRSGALDGSEWAGTVDVRILDDDEDVAAAPPDCSGAVTPFGRDFVETLVAGGVEVRRLVRESGGDEREGAGREAPRGPETGGAGIPELLLVRSSPRAWKGRAGLDPRLRAVAGAALDAPRRSYPVVFGHRRLLDDLGGPGACAWWGRPRAERAAAGWILGQLRS